MSWGAASFWPRLDRHEMMAAMAVRRLLHRRTASLYARLPKCANNAIQLMLFAHWSNLSNSEIQDKWTIVRDDSLMEDYKTTGTIRVRGIPWDKRQLPPGGSFKPVIVRTLKPVPLPHSQTLVE